MIPSERRPSGSFDTTSKPDETTRDDILSALGDCSSRAILRETADRALTAAELSETLDLPLSTVYRKVERLVDVSLVDETNRLSSDGRHPCQYRCAVDEILVAVSDADDRAFDVYLSAPAEPDTEPGG